MNIGYTPDLGGGVISALWFKLFRRSRFDARTETLSEVVYVVFTEMAKICLTTNGLSYFDY